MAQYEAFHVPTLTVFEQLGVVGRRSGYPEHSLEKLEAVRTAGINAVWLALDAGVRVGFGTDGMGETHPGQSRECCSAPRRSPRSTSCDRRRWSTPTCSTGRGSWESSLPGRTPTCSLLSGNPLEDLSVLVEPDGAGIDLVVRSGEVVHSDLP